MNTIAFNIRKLDINGLQFHIQEWGDPDSPKLFMLHGWMDCGASFQFMAPYLADKYHIIAPDLRGFGETEHAPGGYWFPDYFADLDALLDHYSPDEEVDILGHSMGGNIVLMYCGIRRKRIGRALSLEGIGLPEKPAREAPKRYSQWLRQMKSNKIHNTYRNLAVLQKAIKTHNPSLNDDMIEKLSIIWSRPIGHDGSVMLKHDKKHRYVNPIRYNFDDVTETWKLAKAQIGLVMARNSNQFTQFRDDGRITTTKRILNISESNYYIVEDSNHMLHLEQPQSTANCIAEFFA
ncbi:MAG: alpha/beta fold hydrolase [Arenicella sp.]